MRALDKGRAFIVTRNGVPVGELTPLRQRVFVPAESVLAAFAGAPRVALRRFRKDVDAVLDQDPTPRG
jgi:antitoxin (DNA-binding transcriptional repressor) of toxin-antitoxin stability system